MKILLEASELFDEDEVEAVRVCFSLVLPEPAVERVLELRIRRETYDDTYKAGSFNFKRLHAVFFKDEYLLLWRGWHATGEKRYEFHFDNEGKPHGLFTAWYSDGKTMFEGEYLNDKLERPFTHYSEDGALVERHTCKFPCYFERYYREYSFVIN